MIRTLAIAAASLALAAPALAADAAPKADAQTNAAVKAHLDATAASLQARQHLARQGYVNISTLEVDGLGRWSGTATKDGKTTIVAIKLPRTDAPVVGQ